MRSVLAGKGVALCVAAVAALAVAGCGGSSDNSAGGSAGATDQAASSGGGGTQDVKLLLSYKDSISFLSVLVAKDRYFGQEGLNVETLPSDGSEYDIQQMIAGRFDYAVVGAQNVAIGASKDPSIKGIAVLDRDAVTLAVPSSSSVKSVQDLKGKTLGVSDLGGGEVAFLRAVIQDAGLTDDVKIVAVGPGGPAVDKALRDGSIAAYGGYLNDLAGIEAAGLSLRDILPSKYQGLPSNTLAARQGALTSNKDVAVKMIRALGEATKFIEANPDEALQIACKYAPDECTNMASAKVFRDRVVHAEAVPSGETFGTFDYPKMQVLVSTLSNVPNVDVSGLDLKSVYTNTYAQEAASGGGGQ